jgi:uncharacterized membrane protein
MARTLMIDSHVPRHLWNYAVATAVYLLNLLPSAALDKRNSRGSAPPNVNSSTLLLYLRCITVIQLESELLETCSSVLSWSLNSHIN